MDPETGLMVPVATYYGANKAYEEIKGFKITWPGAKNQPPRDVPTCGFLKDAAECRKAGGWLSFQLLHVISLMRTFAPYVTCFSEGFPVVAFTTIFFIAFIALLAAAFLLVYKKMVLEAELNDSWWNVKWEEIRFAEKQNSGLRKSTASLGSASRASLSTTGYTTLTAASTGSAASSMNTTCANISGVLVGMYKGVKVAIKELENLQKLHVDRELLMEIKQVRTKFGQ